MAVFKWLLSLLESGNVAVVRIRLKGQEVNSSIKCCFGSMRCFPKVKSNNV